MIGRLHSSEPRPRTYSRNYAEPTNLAPLSYKKFRIRHHQQIDFNQPEQVAGPEIQPNTYPDIHEAAKKIFMYSCPIFLIFLLVFIFSGNGRTCLDDYNSLGCPSKADNNQQCNRLLQCLQNGKNGWQLPYLEILLTSITAYLVIFKQITTAHMREIFRFLTLLRER